MIKVQVLWVWFFLIYEVVEKFQIELPCEFVVLFSAENSQMLLLSCFLFSGLEQTETSFQTFANTSVKTLNFPMDFQRLSIRFQNMEKETTPLTNKQLHL